MKKGRFTEVQIVGDQKAGSRHRLEGDAAINKAYSLTVESAKRPNKQINQQCGVLQPIDIVLITNMMAL